MPTVAMTSLNAEEGPHWEILKAAGFEARCVDRTANLGEEDQLIAQLQGCCGVLAGSEPYTPRVIESLPELRVIARTGVGFDAVDLPACDANRVVVATTPGVNHHSVAEHTIALLMGVARGLPEQHRRVQQAAWKRISYPRIMGRTIGIVGLGRIGQAVAWRARGLGMKVIAFEPFADRDFVSQWNVELVDLETLISTADFVSLHAPLTEETQHMINAESLARMKPGSILVNTARGGLVDEPALIDALKSGHLQGAGLDVFAVEPLASDSPLTSMDNVLLAGHVAGLDNESHIDTFNMASRIVIQLRDGEWPRECIQNLDGVTDWTWDRS